MNIKTYDKTIKELLLSGKQFIIPRFQRAYSWEKNNYKEFFEDILNCLTIKDGKVIIDQYFLGTMLFVGDTKQQYLYAKCSVCKASCIENLDTKIESSLEELDDNLPF